MTTFLITWNPKRWSWETLHDEVIQFRRRGFVDIRWSCGRTRRIQRGDRIFMLRQSVTPRGIMAAGYATSETFEDSHYDAERTGETAIYLNVRLDALINPETDTILEREQLNIGHLAEVHWDTQSSGIHIPAQAAAQLESAWSAFLSQHEQEPVMLPDEVTTPEQYFEGATRQVTVSIYERCPHARQLCIEHYGCRCSVCGFDFAAVFGELGRGFIHVHHLKPLADIRAEYEIDPVADLRPICPNCHAIIHRDTKMVVTIEELRERIKRYVTSA